ncbi:MAG: ATP-dependent DNA ligase, partial [Candidatus Methanofastidiosia archaeon]
MYFKEFAILCKMLEKTRKRKEKIKFLGEFFKRLSEDELEIALNFVSGRIFSPKASKTLDVSFKTLKKLQGTTQQTLLRKTLTLKDLYHYFEKIANFRGKGSRERKEKMLKSLLSNADPEEKIYIFRLMFGEMQTGVGKGITELALSEATGIEVKLIRRAIMLTSLGEAGRLALMKGANALKSINIEIFKPLEPMLSEMAYSFSEIFKYLSRCAFEFKFDGARIQIHKKGREVKIFSRRLSEVTESLPEIVNLIQDFGVEEVILDGEVVAVRNGRPLPFQELMKRFKRVHDIQSLRKEIPLKLYLFDILYLNGTSLLDEAYKKRRRILEETFRNFLAEKVTTESEDEANEFLERALSLGHEGLMAKSLSSKYTPGARGKRWFKLKPTETLDCVIVAADWGYGRRIGWLSNYHLAVRS